MNERSLRSPAVTSASVMTSAASLVASLTSVSRLLVEDRRLVLPAATFVFAFLDCCRAATSRDVSPTIDLARVTPITDRRGVVGVCEPDDDVSERRCVVGVVAVFLALVSSVSVEIFRLSLGVVDRAPLKLFLFGPGDLGACAVEEEARGSSGVVGSILRVTPGDFVTALARVSGGADHLLRLSRIDPVRTKFCRSGAVAVIVSAFVVSVIDRCRAAVRREVTSAAELDARELCVHAEWRLPFTD